jgi:CIC family chloride channel protein
MGSFFAGVASAPIGAMLMVAEMTGGYALLPPLMLASVVAILLMRHTSIYESQVDDQFQSPAHAGELTVNVLEEMRVADVFERSSDVPVVTPDRGFQAVRDLVLASRDATVPVVTEGGRLVGLITAEQIRPVMDETHLDRFVVAGDIAAPPVFVRPDDDLYRAHELFRASGCPQLPVLDGGTGKPPEIVGMLGYRDMMHAYGRELVRRRER